jgi:uncharacterized protein with von Willebrand factor type A (vWA) domain
MRPVVIPGPGGGRLAENVVHFARVLRHAGMNLGTHKVLDAPDALALAEHAAAPRLERRARAASEQSNRSRRHLDMEMAGEQRIATDQAAVWRVLNDPQVLKACIPGCESIDWSPSSPMSFSSTEDPES